MSDTSVSGIAGSHRYFTEEDDTSLKKEESSSSIIKRQTSASVEVHGSDRTWRETKDAQQGSTHGVASHGGSAAVEAIDIVGPSFVEHAATTAGKSAAFGVAGGAVKGLYDGYSHIEESKRRGEEQKTAVERDAQHVGLIGALDLPSSYKTAQFEGRYRDTPRASGSAAEKVVGQLNADPQGLAILQHHADCGMKAAADALASNQSLGKFLDSHPSIKESCAKDPAFRAGFEAYLSASPNDRKKAEEGWTNRDARATQPQTVRG